MLHRCLAAALAAVVMGAAHGGPADAPAAPFHVGETTRTFHPQAERHWRGARTQALITNIWYPVDISVPEVSHNVDAPGRSPFRMQPSAGKAPVASTQAQHPLLLLSLINGGIALNTIPALCELVFEFRNLPGVDAPAIRARVERYVRETIEPAMQREHPDAHIELDEIAAAPSLDASEQAAITQLVRVLTEDNDKRKVAYGTEAGLFQRAGIPAVLCGPGNIEQAHKANEYVELAQLDACDRFLAKVARSLMVETASA